MTNVKEQKHVPNKKGANKDVKKVPKMVSKGGLKLAKKMSKRVPKCWKVEKIRNGVEYDAETLNTINTKTPQRNPQTAWLKKDKKFGPPKKRGDSG